MSSLESILERIEASRAWENEPWEAPADYPLKYAERAARRKNKRAAESAPLFAHAGLVEQVTPEQVKVKYDQTQAAYATKLISSTNRQAEEAGALVREVSQHLSDEELAEREAYRVRVYPRSIVYDLEYWRKMLEELKMNPCKWCGASGGAELRERTHRDNITL